MPTEPRVSVCVRVRPLFVKEHQVSAKNDLLARCVDVVHGTASDTVIVRVPDPSEHDKLDQAAREMESLADALAPTSEGEQEPATPTPPSTPPARSSVNTPFTPMTPLTPYNAASCATPATPATPMTPATPYGGGGSEIEESTGDTPLRAARRHGRARRQNGKSVPREPLGEQDSTKHFHFERALEEECSTAEVWSTVLPCIEEAQRGGAAAIFLAGAHRSGKTTTMLGENGNGLAQLAISHFLNSGDRVQLLPFMCGTDGVSTASGECTTVVPVGAGEWSHGIAIESEGDVSGALDTVQRTWAEMERDGARHHRVLSVVRHCADSIGTLVFVEFASSGHLAAINADARTCRHAEQSASVLADALKAVGGGAQRVPFRNHAITTALSAALLRAVVLVHLSPAAIHFKATLASLSLGKQARGKRSNMSAALRDASPLDAAVSGANAQQVNAQRRVALLREQASASAAQARKAQEEAEEKERARRAAEEKIEKLSKRLNEMEERARAAVRKEKETRKKLEQARKAMAQTSKDIESGVEAAKREAESAKSEVEEFEARVAELSNMLEEAREELEAEKETMQQVKEMLESERKKRIALRKKMKQTQLELEGKITELEAELEAAAQPSSDVEHVENVERAYVEERKKRVALKKEMKRSQLELEAKIAELEADLEAASLAAQKATQEAKRAKAARSKKNEVDDAPKPRKAGKVKASTSSREERPAEDEEETPVSEPPKKSAKAKKAKAATQKKQAAEYNDDIEKNSGEEEIAVALPKKVGRKKVASSEETMAVEDDEVEEKEVEVEDEEKEEVEEEVKEVKKEVAKPRKKPVKKTKTTEARKKMQLDVFEAAPDVDAIEDQPTKTKKARPAKKRATAKDSAVPRATSDPLTATNKGISAARIDLGFEQTKKKKKLLRPAGSQGLCVLSPVAQKGRAGAAGKKEKMKLYDDEEQEVSQPKKRVRSSGSLAKSKSKPVALGNGGFDDLFKMSFSNVAYEKENV